MDQRVRNTPAIPERGIALSDRLPDLENLRAIEQQTIFIDKLVAARFDESEIKYQIEYAYKLSECAHHPQKRETGERYFEHPRAVAELLVDLRIELQLEASELELELEASELANYPQSLPPKPATTERINTLTKAAEAIDADMVIVALLHDVPEDSFFLGGPLLGRTAYQRASALIRDLFNFNVVKGTMPLTKIAKGEHYQTKDELDKANAEQLHESIRAVLVKIVDRTHNISTLYGTSLERQENKILETERYFLPVFEAYLPGQPRMPLTAPLGLVVERLLANLETTIEQAKRSIEQTKECATSPMPEERRVKLTTPRADQDLFATTPEDLDFFNKFAARGHFDQERDKIIRAYDFSKYALQSIARRNSGESMFDFRVKCTTDLVNNLGAMSIPSDLVIASLLADVVEHTDLFGNRWDTPEIRREKAQKRLSNTFGSEAAAIIIALTKFEREDGRPLSIEEHARYVRQIANAGWQSILLGMQERYHDLATLDRMQTRDLERKLREMRSDYLPAFKAFEAPEISYQSYAVKLLTRLKDQTEKVELEIYNRYRTKSPWELN